MNTKLHAVADANGRPLSFFMTAGQVSDYTGAAALLDDLPKAQWLSATAATRRRLVQGRSSGQGHPALHPRPQVAQRARPVR
jgi:transposase